MQCTSIGDRSARNYLDYQLMSRYSCSMAVAACSTAVTDMDMMVMVPADSGELCGEQVAVTHTP